MSKGDKKDLTYEDLLELATKKKEQIENKLVFIDVRQPEEIKETGLIPGFVHIPLAEVPTALRSSAESFKQMYGVDKPSEDSVLVFSCRSGKRSAEALQKALEQGYTKSKHYAGGWLDWENKTKK